MADIDAQNPDAPRSWGAFVRRLLVVVMAAMAVLLLVAALVVLLLPALGTALGSRLLARMDMPGSTVSVRAVTPTCLVAGPVRLGHADNGLSADQVVASYTLTGIRQGRLDDLVVNRLQATVRRGEDGRWTIAGLPEWPENEAPAAADSRRFRIGRIRIVGAALTVRDAERLAVDIALDGDVEWEPDGSIIVDLTARVFGDSLQVNATLDSTSGDAEVRISSPGTTLSRWRDELAVIFEDVVRLPQLDGMAVIELQTGLKNWVPVSFTIGLSGPRWFGSLEPAAAGGASGESPAQRVSAGFEVVAPQVQVSGKASPEAPAFSYTLSHSIEARQGSALSMTEQGLIRVLTGALQWDGQWQVDAGKARPVDGDLTVSELHAEVLDATVDIDRAACRLLPGEGESDWRVRIASRLGQVQSGSWRLGPGSLDGTLSPQRLEVTTSVLTLDRGDDLTVAASLAGTARRREDGIVYDGSVDVNSLVLAGAPGLDPFAFSLSGDLNGVSLQAERLAAGTWSQFYVEDLGVNLTFNSAAPRADLGARLIIGPDAFNALLPGRVDMGTEGVDIELEGRLAADPEQPLFEMTATAPEKKLIYESQGTTAAGKLGGTLQLRGDLERLQGSGALRLTALELDLPMAKSRFAEIALNLNEALIRPRRLLAATSLQQGLASARADFDLVATAGEASVGADAHLGDISLQLPGRWDGREFALPESPDVVSAGALRLGRIEAGPVSFGASTIAVSLEGHALVFSSDLASSDGSLELDVEGMASAASGFSSRASFQARMNSLADASWLPRWLSQSSPLSIGSLEGALSISGEVFHTPADGFDARFDASLSEAAIKLSDPQAAVGGLNAQLSLESLAELRSSPHQRLSFEELFIERMPFGEGSLSFQLEGAKGVFIERAQVAWCGGTLSTYALQLAPGLDDLEALFYADSIDLAQLFALQNTIKGSAAGILYGKIPLSWRDHKLRYESGFLYAVPGGRGALKIENADALLENLPREDSRVDQAKEALKHLQYDVLRLDVEGRGDLTRLSIRVEGKSALNPSLPPVKLNSTIEANINDLIDVQQQLQHLEFRAQ